MAHIHTAVACNLDTNILLACLPLFETEQVQALEWSFDTVYAQPHLPDWFDDLLTTFGAAGRLVGHGVFFSLFQGRWSPAQQAWLDTLRDLSARYAFDHITEHFGFMSGADFHRGAPLSIPLTTSTLVIGQDRLARIQQACRRPVGLENLAFAYTRDEVQRQGEFLHRLLTPVNGFLILDLHNLYCQSHNFNLPLDDLLALYPLDRVREIHVSGGSWQLSVSEPGRVVRRDTHDDRVPTEVLAALQTAIPRCPDLVYVVLEQLGNALTTEPDRQTFRDDFARMSQLVRVANESRPAEPGQSFLPPPNLVIPSIPLEDSPLHDQQRMVATILETSVNGVQARSRLAASGLAGSAWGVERWEPAMLETAVAIAQKWQHGYPA